MQIRNPKLEIRNKLQPNKSKPQKNQKPSLLWNITLVCLSVVLQLFRNSIFGFRILVEIR